MKKLITLLIISLFSLNAFCQEIQSYSRVIVAKDKDAKTLYQSAKLWFAQNFNYPDKVIQIDDPSGYSITCRASIPYQYDKGWQGYASFKGIVEFSLIIQCKDGRFRAIVTNISHAGEGGHEHQSNVGTIYNMESPISGKGMWTKYYNNVHNEIREKFDDKTGYSNKIFISLETFMNSSNSIVNEEW